MEKLIRIIAENKDQLRSLVWLSLQDGGAISIGITDDAFKMPGFISQIELAGEKHETRANLLEEFGRDAIKNPHFTFHPPMYYHLRANGQPKLFKGIIGVDLIVETDGRMPWIRFISSPIRELSPFTEPKEHEAIKIKVPNDNVSIEVSIDFVKRQDNSLEKAHLLDHCINWGGRVLNILADTRPAQKSTLRWIHES